MQKIIFVTGKGGVGKSTYAAGLALKYAQKGNKTLLVELGEQSYYQEFFSIPQVSYVPALIESQLDVALWSSQEALKEYALHLLRSESLYRLFFENKLSKSLISIAPGLQELSLLGKATSGPRKHGPPVPHEIIVIDSFSTGHFLALLRAPRGMSEAISFGPMGEQSRSIFKTLLNPEICQYHIVSLLEELPYKEGLELKETLRSEFNLNSQIIFNKVIETPLHSNRIPQSPNIIESSTNMPLKSENMLKSVNKFDGKSNGNFFDFLRERLREQEHFLTLLNQESIQHKILPLFYEYENKNLFHQVAERIQL